MQSFIILGSLLLIYSRLLQSRHHHRHHHNRTEHSDKTTVACVGDSITAGSGSTDRWTKTYPAQLEKYLVKKAIDSTAVYETINFGVGGMTVMKDSDMPYWNTQEFTEALKSEPSIVILGFGTNDAKKQNWNSTRFISDYVDMINHFKKLNGPPAIFICLPPPLYRPVYEIQPEVVNEKLLTIIPTIAEMTSTTIIDLFRWMGGSKLAKPNLFLDESKPLRWPNDGCHPNDAGYKVIARRVAKAILGPNYQENGDDDEDDIVDADPQKDPTNPKMKPMPSKADPSKPPTKPVPSKVVPSKPPSKPAPTKPPTKSAPTKPPTKPVPSKPAPSKRADMINSDGG